MNIIPAIDIRGGQCVRLYQGDFDQQTVYNKDPTALACEYRALGFKQLHIVDLDGAKLGKQQNQTLVSRMVGASKLTVQLGGGIRKRSQIESWLANGVSRVVIGTLAVKNPNLVRGWIEQFGPEKIVLALDVVIDDSGTPYVATHGWTKTENITLWKCIDNFIQAGLQNVLCTDISKDGAMEGPNFSLYADVLEKYPQIFLQASGGVRHMPDLLALQDLGAQSAITGRALLDGRISAGEITSFLRAA